MAKYMKVNGIIIKNITITIRIKNLQCKEKEYINGLTGTCMKEILKIMKKTVKENLHGKRINFTNYNLLGIDLILLEF